MGQVFMFICSWTSRNHYYSIYHLFIFIFILYHFKCNIVLFSSFGLSLYFYEFCNHKCLPSMERPHFQTMNSKYSKKKDQKQHNYKREHMSAFMFGSNLICQITFCLTEQYHLLNQQPQFTIYSFIYHTARIGYIAYHQHKCFCVAFAVIKPNTMLKEVNFVKK